MPDATILAFPPPARRSPPPAGTTPRPMGEVVTLTPRSRPATAKPTTGNGAAPASVGPWDSADHFDFTSGWDD